MGNFDKIIRENLGRLSKRLLKSFIPVDVREIIPMPSKMRKTIIEREADNLFLVKPVRYPDFILHLEFQSTNDSNMPLRMAIYNYMARYVYRLEVISIVIYVGNGPMKMDNKLLSLNGSKFKFKLIDIRNMKPGLFLGSNNPKEVILAILAGKDEQKRKLIIKEIINKLPQLTKSSSTLAELLEQLEIVSLLRGKDLQQLIKKQKETMPIIVDISEDYRFLEGKNKGIEEGIEEGLKLATNEIVKNLLRFTNHSPGQIASLVNVPIEFVLGMKNSLEINQDLPTIENYLLKKQRKKKVNNDHVNMKTKR